MALKITLTIVIFAWINERDKPSQLSFLLLLMSICRRALNFIALSPKSSTNNKSKANQCVNVKITDKVWRNICEDKTMWKFDIASF